MAKKSARLYVSLECTVCKNRNYRTSKQTKPRAAKKQVSKLNLSKYCNTCRKHTKHNEKKK
mgnify:CR=1 FL=1